MKIAKAFGITLKELRTDQGLSQEQLALDAGVDRSYVSQLERGLKVPTLTMLFTLADSLNCSPTQFVALLEKNLR